MSHGSTWRRIASGLAAIALAATMAALSAGPASASVNWHTLRAHNAPGQCLDSDTRNIARVQIWQCGGTSQQTWNFNTDPSFPDEYDFILNKRTNQMIGATYDTVSATGVVGNAGPNGAGIWAGSIFRVYYANNDGRWFQVLQIVNAGTPEMCLNRVSNSNGALVGVAPCDANSPSQKWEISN